MESEVLCLQESAALHQPDKRSQILIQQIFQTNFNHFPIYAYVSQVDSHSHVLQLKFCAHFYLS
jgi:hypothetical protein